MFNNNNMFTFYRVGCEPEDYIEDYSIHHIENDEDLSINNYTNEEQYDMSNYPVVSIDRKHQWVELYGFYTDALPIDLPMMKKAIIDLVELKNELNIENYTVVGDGANMYYELYKTFSIK